MTTDHQGPLAEFAALRQEIDARNRNQHQIMSLQLTTAGGIFALVMSKPHVVGILALVPVTSFLLCGRFITQGYAVERIARYIREELSPRVPGQLRWEEWQREQPRDDYRWSWFAPLLLSFPGAGLLAIGGCLVYVFVVNDRPFTDGLARTLLVIALALGIVPALASAGQLRRLRGVSRPRG